MKISLQWLGDFLPGPFDAQQLADLLTHAGFPVEGIEQVGPDTALDVEVTSNRGDMLSHAGAARELAALLKRPFTDVSPKVAESRVPASGVAAVSIEAADLCPHYVARIIRNVRIGPSPAWLARRLEAVGLRPINNVVDVTNYVLFEMGQPLHAFDFDRLQGRRIIVRRARPGEKLVSLDGKQRELMPDMLVIADAADPVALAGVMGGQASEVSPGTTNILLESARFDPLSIRKTARALAMRSDSSYRFERGIDPTLPHRASLRAAQLILETAGGELLGGAPEAGAPGDAPKKITLRLARLQQVLGVELPAEAVVDAFSRLHLSPRRTSLEIECTVPSHRLDITQEIDLVEEAARLIGYDAIPLRDEISIRVTPPDPAAAAIETIRSTLAAAGFFEAITFSFVSDLLAGGFIGNGQPLADALPRAASSVRKADAHLRPSILPGLLESLRRNQANGTADARLFEIGSTFGVQDKKLTERRRVGLVGGTDLRQTRGVVEALLARLDAARPMTVRPAPFPGYGRGASGIIEWGGAAIGEMGLIDRDIAQKLSLKEPPAAAELDLAALLAGAQPTPQLRPLAAFPAVERDLSLVLPESVRFERLEGLVHSLKLPHLEGLQYVTTFRGKALGPGAKSVTIRLHFRAADRTLTGPEVDDAVQQVAASAQRDLKASLRA